jgi:hypothetical protein
MKLLIISGLESIAGIKAISGKHPAGNLDIIWAIQPQPRQTS